MHFRRTAKKGDENRFASGFVRRWRAVSQRRAGETGDEVQKKYNSSTNVKAFS
jgi:hypothetical protein